jgi:hypothetical protein
MKPVVYSRKITVNSCLKKNHVYAHICIYTHTRARPNKNESNAQETLFLLCFILRQGLAMYPRLAGNYLCSLGWPWTLDLHSADCWDCRHVQLCPIEGTLVLTNKTVMKSKHQIFILTLLLTKKKELLLEDNEFCVLDNRNIAQLLPKRGQWWKDKEPV